ncbi:uncharacterized protein LOC105794472 [Gossypium raimondii]|uniref:uncharacterized protein LOC105794472 n=1 Tax=Gossypium raimondii TaxID=29730 RepID=UPI00227A4842|nr:uncharacterized protein LOC105794472 [Gossypium raimondii]
MTSKRCHFLYGTFGCISVCGMMDPYTDKLNEGKIEIGSLSWPLYLNWKALMQLFFCHFVARLFILCSDFHVLVQEHGVDQADLIAFLLELSFHTPGETLTGRDIPCLYVTLRDADGGTKEPLILCRGVNVGREIAGHDVASG